MTHPSESDPAAHIRDIPDWPTPGVTFKDLTPLLADGAAFGRCVDELAAHFDDLGIDRIVGTEARGFIVAAPVAHRIGAGFVPVRKPGKLPWETIGEDYELEYGNDSLEIHRDALRPGQRVAVIDDILATGGTAAATAQLVTRLGARVVGFGFVVELAFLAGRSRLGEVPVESLIVFD